MTFPAKRIVAALVGQSNEAGADAQTTSRKSRFGAPCKDPIPPEGGVNGSWWPITVENLGRNGTWLRIYNTAKGATGLADDWVGRNGGVLAEIEGTGWDANSYLSDALAQANQGTYDERWIFISLGQTDADDATDLADWTAALERTTQYFLNNGIKVAIGFTSASPADGGRVTWNANIGQPGVTAALATFASNSNVIAGGNLYEYWGESVKLRDNSHMTASQYKKAGEVWSDALIAGGV